MFIKLVMYLFIFYMQPEFKTLQGIDTVQLCDTFNLAFSDYLVPFHLTPAILQQKMEGENLRRAFSIGAFFNGELGGFILQGPDDDKHPKVLYNGGTGVIPAFRGQRLVQQMYGHFIPVYQQQGVRRLLLEVISTNLPAIKAYKATGFRKERVLHCYKGDIKAGARPGIEIRKSPSPDWERLGQFDTMQPSWSNSVDSRKREAPYVVTWEAYIDGKRAGYITVAKDTRRIRSIAVAPEMRRRGVGNTLLHTAAQQLPGAFSILNIDDAHPEISAFLEQAGLTKYLSQYEMAMDI